MSHPAVDLDDVVHQRIRLAVLAVLAETRRADFTFLRDRLGTTDGNLSRHLQVLADAGLVLIRKGFEGKRSRTWVSATGRGLKALTSEMAALKEIVGRFEAYHGADEEAGRGSGPGSDRHANLDRRGSRGDVGALEEHRAIVPRRQ